ncbi:MAG: peptide deformylase [Rhodospirillales bacterium 12-54-5]|nr:MAG: peptide deformylase [Rhodospirillales bacterium 12-54-5]
MLDLVIAPDPIYKTTCTPVAAVDDTVRATLDAMMETLKAFHAMGIGAPMVGITQRLVTVSLEDETGKLHEYKMVNPTITERSSETSTMEEASITFLGVSAPVTRPSAVTVAYLDEHGASQTLHATGILAVCLQHEMDYLDGKTILDYQSPMKRDMMKRKMEKQKRTGPIPHIHGAHCNH